MMLLLVKKIAKQGRKKKYKYKSNLKMIVMKIIYFDYIK